MLKRLDSSVLKQLKFPFYIFDKKKLIRQINLFNNHFNGRVLYAVKSNPSKFVIKQLSRHGVSSFDAASLNEIKLIRKVIPKANIFFMNPVKSRNSIQKAYYEYNVKDFALDSLEELEKINEETNFSKKINLHLRLRIKNNSSIINMSKKFGVDKKMAPKLLKKLSQNSEKVGLSFHVGSQCMNPNAYENAINICSEVIYESGVKLSFLNVGGGFPSSYPGFKKIPIKNYFKIIHKGFSNIKKTLSKNIELLSEPGRSLVAESMSLIVRVELRKKDKLYINDGIYGSLNNAGLRNFNYPVKIFNRDDKKSSLVPFSFYGPTCDSLDKMKGPFFLPNSIREGDLIEIKKMGAYSFTMKTDFNDLNEKNEIFTL